MRFVAVGDGGERGRARRGRRLVASLLALLAASLLAPSWFLPAQEPARASERADATAVAEAIERLPVVGSVLLTGAHPDDENSVLLPYLALGLRLRTAYLSATRGDGGQNLIGTEQYEALGILRTEELLAARRRDGAEQFFGQAYDFGFSKNAEETFVKWGHEAVLGDFVRVIRTFRPDILISRFSGTPSDGHGNHQAAGILTREAFRAAADPNRFPEQIKEGLKPWQASRLFYNLGGGRGGGGAVALTISMDGFNPIYGRTYPEIGTEARSMHRSQGMGLGFGRGQTVAGLRLEDSMPGLPAPAQGFTDGVDMTLNRFTTLAGGSAGVAQRVEAIRKAIDAARNMLSPTNPAKVLPVLGQGLAQLRELRSEIERSSVAQEAKGQALFLLKMKEDDFVRAICLAGGVSVEALAESGEIIPGGTFAVLVTGLVRAPDLLQAGEISLQGPPGWKIEKVSASPASKSANRVEAKFQVSVPADAPVSQPYWLVNPRPKDYFPPPPVPWVGAAQNPPLVRASAQFSLAVEGQAVQLEPQADAVYRYADRVYGEREQPLTVVPPLAVWMEPDVAVFPTAATSAQQFLLVRVRNNRSSEQKGLVRLNLPSGWRSEPPGQNITLAGRGDEVSVRFQVSVANSKPATQAEKQSAQAVAEVQVGTGRQACTATGRNACPTFSTGYEVVDYPHVQARYWFQPAMSKLLRFDVKVAPGLRVGYVMGSGDDVPEALKQMGVTVEQLSPDDLAFGNLRRFDVIVTGIRAYEVRKDLSVNQARLMEFVQGGGVLIVQYGRGGGFSEPLGPYPLRLGSGPRVTVEESPVEILEPSHPLFQAPNKITLADFEGWVQERGTYFMESWDPQYKPMLESHDPGESPLKGGLLLASYGKGLYIYSGYTWFRQLPEGVPGAYRIFANMVSLGKTTASRARSEPRLP